MAAEAGAGEVARLVVGQASYVLNGTSNSPSTGAAATRNVPVPVAA
ncbi:hypothetical protein BLA14095_03842 [Burkholderia lata]|nr:hypothetical protein BLA14095_03842 [Burkholderia lata]